MLILNDLLFHKGSIKRKPRGVLMSFCGGKILLLHNALLCAFTFLLLFYIYKMRKRSLGTKLSALPVSLKELALLPITDREYGVLTCIVTMWSLVWTNRNYLGDSFMHVKRFSYDKPTVDRVARLHATCHGWWWHCQLFNPFIANSGCVRGIVSFCSQWFLPFVAQVDSYFDIILFYRVTGARIAIQRRCQSWQQERITDRKLLWSDHCTLWLHSIAVG